MKLSLPLIQIVSFCASGAFAQPVAANSVETTNNTPINKRVVLFISSSTFLV
jgi:hypothetical protein